MKEYLKMADVFEVGVVESDHVVSISVDCLNDQWPGDCSPNEYAAHAINSHDGLVAEVERLTVMIGEKNKKLIEADDLINQLYDKIDSM